MKRLNAVVAAALLLFGSSAWASELRVPEDDLVERWFAGEVGEARDGLAQLVDQHFEAFDTSVTMPTVDDAEPARSLILAIRALRVWETLEVTRRLEGSPTSKRSLDAVVTRAQGLGDRVGTLGSTRRGAQESLAAGAAKRMAASLLYNTAVFVRDTSRADLKEDFVTRSQALAGNPRSATDAVDDADMMTTFGIAPAANRQSGGGASIPDPPSEEVTDASDPLLGLVDQYYSRLYAGDLAGLAGLLPADPRIEEFLDAVVEAQVGWRLDDRGPVSRKALGSNGEYEVTLSHMTLSSEDGTQTKRVRDQLVARQTGEGWTLVYPGPQREREAGQ